MLCKLPFWKNERDKVFEERKTMEEVYLIAQRNCGLREGDRVKVKRKARSKEAGWTRLWPSSMDMTVGLVGKIDYIGDSGVYVDFHSLCYYYPFFVLEKVEKDKKSYDFYPLEPVLVRDEDLQKWRLTLFDRVDKDIRQDYIYLTVTSIYKQCISYKGNEHLHGTSNSPEKE